uniref:glycosyltransferase family 2 protein n=1 Tax=Flavobacterium sp. TaxID=239 RepID=UPI00404A63D7
MLHGKLVAVVVPCYNEESQIGMVIESMPDFVDRIVIVNDKSKDRTSEVVMDYIQKDTSEKVKIIPYPNPVIPTIYNEADQVVEQKNKEEVVYYTKSKVENANPEIDRIILINHLDNGGVGAGISSGYKWCKDHEIDCVAVMAGDGQMDPSELEDICTPVILENIDYVKGNRLRHPSAKFVIPRTRFIGNSVLSMLTKIASGYWKISDTQTGYTAISLSALNKIKIYEIYKSYGMPNDLLVKLNIASCSLKEITIKPVYRVGEQSKMKVGRVIRRVSWLLLKLFFVRLWTKYLFRDFHPLFLFYNLSFILGIISIPYGIKIIAAFITGEVLSYEPILAFFFLFIGAFQSLFFAMWMDIQDNERLYK